MRLPSSIDNCAGNTTFQRSPVISLDQCIKCNICTTACPVSAVTDLFPSPKYEGPQAERFRLPSQLSPDQSVDYCTGCRVCNMVCPNGVKIAELNARARAAMVKSGKVPLRLRLRNNLVARAELLGKVGLPIAPVANTLLSLKPARQFAEFALSIHHDAPLPSFSRHRFTTWFHKRQNPLRSARKVVYFHGCSTQYYEPRVGRAAVQVLERNGFEVIVPAQNCCGLPLLSNGEFPAARRYLQSNVRHLVEYARQGIPIIGTSTSCSLTLKEEAPELLDMHDEDTRLVAENTYDFNEFMLSLLDQGLLDTDLSPIPYTLVYHIPCQYRGHRIGKPGLPLLGLIPGLNIIDSRADCCGIAGTYGYKKEKYAISMDIGQPLFDFITHSYPESPLVVCDSETCRWQITHATGKPAIHPVELLAQSYGIGAITGLITS
ncbi:MAG: anaerobic glycerol-3-phosphate dehydrogenase subunit C [Anaerolineales bacterium]|nr:anaerobic glycerol-3-phosphate dehydrogenase subunit C [Anaerolineae bacterium]PWB50922.1 MAG: anaerobic glycerol-3-phosphate dehydrogenase subunit C [Anaerolineales bacterium]